MPAAKRKDPESLLPVFGGEVLRAETERLAEVDGFAVPVVYGASSR